MRTPSTADAVAAFAAAALMLLTAACGDDTAAPVATPATPVVTDEALGGFGPPAAIDGEFDQSTTQSTTQVIVGTADLDERGCWWVVGNGDRGLLIAPPGTTLGNDGITLVSADGIEITDGAELDIGGVLLYSVDDLPGGADGKWGNYLAFCDPRRPIVVAATLTVASSTDVEAAAAELADAGAALFDTDHGCGYGFATGSADQRWALRLSPTTSDPIEAGLITLPDARFDAAVTTGRHLFANHCDDVAEWFEPDPTVAATWPIVAGSFDYPGSDGIGDCSDGAVVTELIDAGVDLGVDGAVVELAPITIDNEFFGCFAG